MGDEEIYVYKDGCNASNYIIQLYDANDRIVYKKQIGIKDLVLPSLEDAMKEWFRENDATSHRIKQTKNDYRQTRNITIKCSAKKTLVVKFLGTQKSKAAFPKWYIEDVFNRIPVWQQH